MVIGQTERLICYSDKVKRTRVMDLLVKLDGEKIYKPEDTVEARLQDLTAKILSYKKQLSCTKSFTEEKLIKTRIAEIKWQKSLKV